MAESRPARSANAHGTHRRRVLPFYGASVHAIAAITLSHKLGELITGFPMFNRLAPEKDE